MDVVEAKGFTLLPPAEGKCRICAADHEPERPHDASSLFYQRRFNMRYKRPGTWADAVAHCDSPTARRWRAMLTEHGYWSEPPEGVSPIPEPIDG